MFKQGDIVVVVDNRNLGISFKIGDKFKVRYVNDGTIALEGKWGEYGVSHFNLDLVYLRTLKIKKLKEIICSNKGIKWF